MSADDKRVYVINPERSPERLATFLTDNALPDFEIVRARQPRRGPAQARGGDGRQTTRGSQGRREGKCQ